MQAHTNADDATRYRQDSEVAQWVAKDPLSRMKTYLTDRGLLDDDRAAGIAEKAEAVATQLREGLSEEVPVEPQDLFKYVFSTPTPQLKEQSAMLADDSPATPQTRTTHHHRPEANGNVTPRLPGQPPGAAQPNRPSPAITWPGLNTAMADAMHADPLSWSSGRTSACSAVCRITDGPPRPSGRPLFDTPLPSRASSAWPWAWR
jgi:hypothetical protein